MQTGRAIPRPLQAARWATLCPQLLFWRTEKPPNQAKCHQNSADDLNENLGVAVGNERASKQEKRSSQHNNGGAHMLAAARCTKRPAAKTGNMSCCLCRSFFTFVVFHKHVVSPNNQGERRGAAAAAGRLVSKLDGCLPFAPPCGLGVPFEITGSGIVPSILTGTSISGGPLLPIPEIIE